MTKTENALVACEKVLNGIEDNTITVTSALLLCLKIARLLNDTDAIMWLQYEYGGYPRNKNGYIQKEAWQIAWGKGRGYIEDGKELVFSEIASELEEKIAAQRSAVNNFTTQGASVSREWAAVAMNKLTTTVSSSTGVLVRQIASSEKQLTILKSKYYVLGLLHDIGRKFGVRHLGHVSDGYAYMMCLGYDEAAKICLTHSFNNHTINEYIGKFDVSDEEMKMIKTELARTVYDDYDRLIQLCDSLAGAEGVLEIEDRMNDIKKRYGSYPQDKWDSNMRLKRYFEKKMKKDIYLVCEKDSFVPEEIG